MLTLFVFVEGALVLFTLCVFVGGALVLFYVICVCRGSSCRVYSIYVCRRAHVVLTLFVFVRELLSYIRYLCL